MTLWQTSADDDVSVVPSSPDETKDEKGNPSERSSAISNVSGPRKLRTRPARRRRRRRLLFGSSSYSRRQKNANYCTMIILYYYIIMFVCTMLLYYNIMRNEQ